MIEQLTLPYSHINFAHTCWKSVIAPGSKIIDATCGNGYDTLFLARQLLNGKIYALDIQKEAIESTKQRLGTHLSEEQISNILFFHGCHSKFPDEITPSSVTLIVYNLGYLPKGDKTKTTLTNSTIKSLQNALDLIKPGGMISITCYPGHPEGAEEEKAILSFIESLSSDTWRCRYYQQQGKPHAPSLLLLERR